MLYYDGKYRKNIFVAMLDTVISKRNVFLTPLEFVIRK